MGTITHSVTTVVPPEKIADQICTAIEGGCGYWLEKFTPITVVKEFRQRTDGGVDTGPWYALPSVWSNEFVITCKTFEDGTETFTHKSIGTGLAWLSEHHPDYVAEIMDESGDTGTADAFLQACLFGEIRYG